MLSEGYRCHEYTYTVNISLKTIQTSKSKKYKMDNSNVSAHLYGFVDGNQNY